MNVGSVAGLTAHYPVAYTASKWALRGLSQVAAMELGPRGIRVNTVHPGFIETPMTASAKSEFRQATMAETPLGRTGSVEEVAGVVLFLLSPLVFVCDRCRDPGGRRPVRPRRSKVCLRRHALT